jgi:DNA-binding protein Fis
MITVLVGENREKLKEMLFERINRPGNTAIGIVKQGDVIKLFERDSLKDIVELKDKIIELGDALLRDKEGILHRAVLEKVEKLLVEYVLERVDGNQLRAARILGINRNTMHGKIKKLGINPNQYK